MFKSREAATTVYNAQSDRSGSVAPDGQVVFYQESEAEEIIRMSELSQQVPDFLNQH